ncbi:MAG TPA: type II secretion system protein GspK [Planctomycetota bacterium]|nr:type II secretion system protein GspK [Planctomycetota bacterium]
MPTSRARRPPTPTSSDTRRGERGVSILLAMLVLFVLVVVIFQVKFDATVELDQARATVENARMAHVADAAFQQARSALLMDIEQASSDQGGAGSDSSGGGGGGGSPFGLGGGGSQDDGSGDTHADDSGGGSGGDSSEDGSGDSSGQGTGADVSDVIARTDSKLDDWQDSVALQPPVGNDFTLWVEVVDEDSKINLLGLWTPDETERAKQHEMVRNLLDKAFEGTSLDLSWTDATEILDKLDKWVSGDRGSFDPIPKPKLKKSNADDKAKEEGTLATAVLDENEQNYPLTLPELLDIEGLLPEHLHGFVEDDVFHPGLEEYLTVWSQVELKPKPPETDPFSGSPFTKGSLFDKPGAGSGSSTGGSTPGSDTGDAGDGSSGDDSGGDDGSADYKPTNDGLVNANTAPQAVLRALAPDDIPTSFLERIVEFRNRIDELRTAGKLDNVGSLFDSPTAGGADSGSSDSGSDSGGKADSLFGDEGDDDPTKYVFEKPEDVIPKVSEEFGITLNVDPDVLTEFAARLAVNSQVFTIKVLVLDQQTGRRTSYRAVVWRMEGGEKPVVLTLLPLEPYYDPRRLKDYPADIADKSQERFERWTDQGYMPPH